jgi:hypothetical protein
VQQAAKSPRLAAWFQDPALARRIKAARNPCGHGSSQPGPDSNGPFGPQFQLWRSDGTVAGTYALGISNSSINGPPAITQVGGSIYYIGGDATRREGLFVTDGLHQGVFIASLTSNGNPLAANLAGRPFVDTGGKLFFTAETANGLQLWVASTATPGATPGARTQDSGRQPVRTRVLDAAR